MKTFFFHSKCIFNFSILLVLVIIQVGLSPARAALAAPAPQPAQPSSLLAPPDPTPSVSVSTGNVTVGSSFTITATFDSTGNTGYGPFIDLYIPRTGADGVYPGTTPNPGGNLYDGIFPAKTADPASPDSPQVDYTATYQGSALTVYTLTFPDDGGGTGCVDHPLALDTSGNFLQVCGTAGDQLVTAVLPFGSFTAGQPPITVQIPAYLSDLADVGSVPLTIHARAGFQFGATPTVDWCCTTPTDTTILSDTGVPTTWTATGDVTPTVFTFTKSGAADTATGPNYPQTYTLTVDIAAGQTVTGIDITDSLPSNIYYDDNLQSTPAASSITHEPAAPGVYSSETIQLHYDSITGPSSGHAIVVTFDYYLPQLDAGSADVVPATTGTPTTTVNNASVSGSWTPIDQRDSPATVTGTGIGTGTNRALKAGKSSSIDTDNAPSGTSPGDIVQYTVNADISDYFAFDQLTATDTIGDGQHFFTDGTHVPHLVITENGSSQSFDFGTSNYTVKCNYTGGPGAECKDGTDGTLTAGDTQVVFDVSTELSDGGLSDQVLGGLVNDGGSANDGQSNVQIIFYTQVLDHYTDQYSGANLKQGDSLGDDASVTGRLLDISTCTSGTCSPYSGNPTVTDGGSGNVSVPKGVLTKSIYAVNGTACSSQPCTNVKVAPGDTVTYRLVYNLDLGDFAALKLTDFLPLPIFKADDPNATGGPFSGWTEDTVNAVPDSGKWNRGPTDDQHSQPGYTGPSVSNTSSSGDNSVIFDFGSYDDASNTPRTIDVLFTVSVTHDPYADGLLMTNQAQEQDNNSAPVTASASEIVQLTLTEPVLVSDKSAVSTSHAGINPSPAISSPIVFAAPGNSGQPWSGGAINSNYLDAHSISSDISGVDGSDLVKFAIVIQNTGSSADGAYDITIKDTLPSGYILPNIGTQNINLQVYRGDGTALNFVNASGGTGLLDQGIQIVDPANDPSIPPTDPTYGHGACQAHDATNGKNVIIVTYDLEVSPDVAPGQQIKNQGELTNYSGSEGGPNYLSQPQVNTSTTTIGNFGLAKTLLSTEINNAHNSDTQAVIGELVHYQLQLTMPEGISPNTVITDTLPTGLAFVSADAFGNSDSTHLSYTGSNAPVITNNGRTVTISLGTVTNTDTDNTTAETLTWQYTVVVLNVSGNQETGSTTLRNSASVSWDTLNTQGNTVSKSVGPVHAANVTVIGPAITTTKTVTGSPADAGNTVTYTITLTNTGGASGADAFEVTWSDSVPTDMTYVANSLAFGTCAAATKSVNDASAPTLTASMSEIPYGASCQLTFQATVDSGVTTNQTITNTATTQWTSLSDSVDSSGTPIQRSTYNASSVERTGADFGGAGTLNDYFSQGQTDVTISSPGLTKQIIRTSDTHTSSSNVTIGEVITYGIKFTVPEALVSSDTVVDTLPSGLALIGGSGQIITSASSSSGLLTKDFSGSIGSSSINEVTTPGSSSITFTFGNIDTPGDNDTTNNTILLQYQAVVLNVTGNVGFPLGSPTTLANSATNQVGSGSPSSPVSATTTVVEAKPTMTKTVSDDHPGPGETVTYTLAIDNNTASSSADAFNVALTDTIDSDLTLDLSSIQVTPTGWTPTVTNNSTANQIDILFDSVPLGDSVTVQYKATVNSNVSQNTTIQNTGNLTWTSLPTVDSNTRTGTVGSTTLPNNYFTSANVSLNVSRDLNKTIASGSVPDDGKSPTILPPTLPDVYIGEILNYQVVLTVPPGATNSATMTDILDRGLAFVGCTSITPQSADVTTDISGSSSNDFSSICSNPTVSTEPAGSSNPADPGRKVVFDFGNLNNANAASQTITVNYQAVILNVQENVNGAALNNNAEWNWSTGSLSTSASTVTVKEAQLAIQKTVDPKVASIGSTVTFNLTVSHSSQSEADAYDALVTDSIPSNLKIDSSSVVVTGSANLPTADVTVSGNVLTVYWRQFPLGEMAQVTFTAKFVGPSPVQNTATVQWSSIQIDPRAPLTAQSTFNANSTERRYSPISSPGINDYQATSSATLRRPITPETGFSPGVQTILPIQPLDKGYASLGDLWLEIPHLGVKLPIVGIPVVDGNWDLTWLGDQAGYLDGTAYPTHAGNSVVTAHVYTADGLPGPFVDLHTLKWGDQIIIHLDGQRYIYQVRENKVTSPSDITIFKHEDYPWLTLITCKDYNASTGTYAHRVAVGGILVKVEPDTVP